MSMDLKSEELSNTSQVINLQLNISKPSAINTQTPSLSTYFATFSYFYALDVTYVYCIYVVEIVYSVSYYTSLSGAMCHEIRLIAENWPCWSISTMEFGKWYKSGLLFPKIQLFQTFTCTLLPNSIRISLFQSVGRAKESILEN